MPERKLQSVMVENISQDLSVNVLRRKTIIDEKSLKVIESLRGSLPLKKRRTHMQRLKYAEEFLKTNLL